MKRDEELSKQLKIMMAKAKDSMEIARHSFMSKNTIMTQLPRHIMQFFIHFRQFY